MATGRQIITSALNKIGANAANAIPTEEDINLGLETLNQWIDSKSNEFLNIHTVKPYYFPLQSNKNTYTVGPTGDWVTQRPMRTEKARLMMTPSFASADFTADVTTGDSPLTVTFTSILS